MTSPATADPHEPLVRAIAKQMLHELDLRAEMDDVVAFGFQGLIEARRSYDPDRGTFEAYAHFRIRGAMLDGARKMSDLPRKIHYKRKAAEAASWLLQSAGEKYEQEGGARTIEDAALAFDDLMAKVKASEIAAAVGETEKHGTIEDTIITQLDTMRVRKALETLTATQQRVIRWMYYDDWTMDRIGVELDRGKASVCRIHAAAIENLRKALS